MITYNFDYPGQEMQRNAYLFLIEENPSEKIQCGIAVYVHEMYTLLDPTIAKLEQSEIFRDCHRDSHHQDTK
jgi:hypothetical protein